MALSCVFYKIMIDPLLHNLRNRIAALIPRECSVIEIGAGTGAQSLLLARTGRRVVGIDINEVMTSCASKRAKELNLQNITYHTADGSDIHFIDDKEFDYATITLALHELSEELRMAILKEMKRIAKKLINADYSAPLPKTFSGWFSHRIEQLAGGSHYAGFKDYQERQGLPPLIRKMDMTIERQHSAANNTILILEVTED